MLAAVKGNGSALKYASVELLGDREVVLTAVKDTGWALRFASTALRANREVVLAAVNDTGFALKYASAALQAHPLVLAVNEKNTEGAREYLVQLGKRTADSEQECTMIGDEIVEVERYFPDLHDAAQEASAAVESPWDASTGEWTAAHKRKRAKFESDVFACLQ